MWANIPRSQSSIWSLVRRYLVQETPEQDISEQLRNVMRNVPQPVALAVAAAPAGTSKARYHGTTLSSFTSLTLHPYPMVAFSLRLPSRLADYIRPPNGSATLSSPSQYPSSPVHPPSTLRPHSPPTTGHISSSDGLGLSDLPPISALTISLLSHSHAHLADKFSRPGLDMATAFSPTDFDLSPDSSGPPGVKDAMGILHCDVVTSVPLRDIRHGPLGIVPGNGAHDRPQEVTSDDAVGGDEIHGSELFICRVSGVKQGDEGLHIDPLLYWRRKYISVQNQSELPYTW